MAASLIAQFEARGLEIDALTKELEGLKAASESGKAELTAKVAELSGLLETAKTSESAIKAELETVKASAQAEKEASDKAIAELKAKVEQQAAAMALAPLGDVSEGREPVSDGAACEADGDAKAKRAALKEQCLKMRGAEQSKFYMAHKIEIDQAYLD